MRLLRLEFKKLLPYKVFWFFMVAYFILIPTLLASFPRLEIKMGRGTTLGFEFYDFPDVWHNVSYMMSWFNIVLYFFFIVLITNEYQFKTMRQHVIDGLSREEVIWSKLQLIGLYSVLSTVFVSAVAFGCGYFLTESYDPQILMNKTAFIGGLGLQTLGYLLFVFIISLVLKKQGFSIIFFVLYFTVLENILRYKIIPEPYHDYLPLYVFGQLISNPFPAYFGQEVLQAPTSFSLWLAGGYCVGLTFIAYIIFKKQNL